MTKAELEERIKCWQEQLGLQEWSIVVKLVEGDDVTDDAWATGHINNSKEEAVITLAKGRTDSQQVKSSVHELVHVVLYPMWLLAKQGDNAEEYARAEEKAAKRLTNALYQEG